MDKTVLVTGGAGYIGSHTCKFLAESGYHPVVLDNLVYGHEWAVQWGPLIKGDILDDRVLDDVFGRHRPAAVIHFAAYAYVGESVGDPGKYYVNNVVGTLRLLDAMRRHGCLRIIFSSTCATYGEPEAVPISEEHPQHPINPYGRGKLMVEQILNDYDAAYGLKHVALRYFNAAGADPSGKIGESHRPETHLIPLAILAALDQAPPLTVFGNDYPTPDGTAIRDYVHVNDLASAHVQALAFLLKEKASDRFNLGTGQGHSVLEILTAIHEVSGVKVPFEQGPRRPGDPPELVAEASRVRKALGWQTEFSQIRSIVESAWNWHSRDGHR